METFENIQRMIDFSDSQETPSHKENLTTNKHELARIYLTTDFTDFTEKFSHELTRIYLTTDSAVAQGYGGQVHRLHGRRV